MDNNTTKFSSSIVLFIVAVLVVIAGVYYFVNRGASTDSVVDTELPQPTVSGLANSINVSDQFPGNIVYVNSVTFAQPGFVGIYTDASGSLGKKIGSAHFNTGTAPGKITLTEKTVDGGLYYAVLQSEAGVALTNARGVAVQATFHATSHVPDTKG